MCFFQFPCVFVFLSPVYLLIIHTAHQSTLPGLESKQIEQVPGFHRVARQWCERHAGPAAKGHAKGHARFAQSIAAVAADVVPQPLRALRDASAWLPPAPRQHPRAICASESALTPQAWHAYDSWPSPVGGLRGVASASPEFPS